MDGGGGGGGGIGLVVWVGEIPPEEGVELRKDLGNRKRLVDCDRS